MNVRQNVKQLLQQIERSNAKSAKEYGSKLLSTLEHNLKNGQSIEDNAGTIARYKNIRPRALNAMQDAFARAVS